MLPIRKGRLAMDGSTQGGFAEKAFYRHTHRHFRLMPKRGYVLGPNNLATAQHRGGPPAMSHVRFCVMYLPGW